MIRIRQDPECARDTQGSGVIMLLNNAQICLNMPEIEPKRTVQAN